MPRKKIRGGYYIKARQIKNSPIAHAAPCVREIWDYLLREANHRDEKYKGKLVKRGQLFRSYRQIRDDLSWKVGYRTERYSESQTKHTMSLLTKELMIATTKEPRGVLITVLNYDYFQNPKNYERTNEYTNERTNEGTTSLPSINKKKEERRKDPPIPPLESRKQNGRYPPPELKDVISYFQSNGYSIEAAKKAFNYYEANKDSRLGNWHDSRGNVVRAWKQKMISVWFKPENRDSTGDLDEWAMQ